MSPLRVVSTIFALLISGGCDFCIQKSQGDANKPAVLRSLLANEDDNAIAEVISRNLGASFSSKIVLLSPSLDPSVALRESERQRIEELDAYQDADVSKLLDADIIIFNRPVQGSVIVSASPSDEISSEFGELLVAMTAPV